jgi:hypothetical protein
MAPQLNADQKREIEKFYVAGLKPTEIARRMDRKAASVRQHLYRAGLTKRREEIAEVKKQTVAEALAKVRQDWVDDFEAMLSDIAAGLKIDAQKLRNAWYMAHDAASVVSLMRAKSLLLNCAMKLYGVEGNDNAKQPAPMLTFVTVQRHVLEHRDEKAGAIPVEATAS